MQAPVASVVKIPPVVIVGGAVRYDRIPGMKVSTLIHTGQRTVIEYLLVPFLNARGEALRER